MEHFYIQVATVIFAISFLLTPANGFQCDEADRNTFGMAFQKYLTQFNVTDVSDHLGYGKAVKHFLEIHGLAGTATICHYFNDFKHDLKEVEECLDPQFAGEALGLPGNSSAVDYYFNEMKQMTYACGPGSKSYQLNLDCIRKTIPPAYCKNENGEICFGVKQEFRCLLNFYRENCGIDAEKIACWMLKSNHKGVCLINEDCENLASAAFKNYGNNVLGVMITQFFVITLFFTVVHH